MATSTEGQHNATEGVHAEGPGKRRYSDTMVAEDEAAGEDTASRMSSPATTDTESAGAAGGMTPTAEQICTKQLAMMRWIISTRFDAPRKLVRDAVSQANRAAGTWSRDRVCQVGIAVHNDGWPQGFMQFDATYMSNALRDWAATYCSPNWEEHAGFRGGPVFEPLSECLVETATMYEMLYNNQYGIVFDPVSGVPFVTGMRLRREAVPAWLAARFAGAQFDDACSEIEVIFAFMPVDSERVENACRILRGDVDFFGIAPSDPLAPYIAADGSSVEIDGKPQSLYATILDNMACQLLVHAYTWNVDEKGDATPNSSNAEQDHLLLSKLALSKVALPPAVTAVGDGMRRAGDDAPEPPADPKEALEMDAESASPAERYCIVDGPWKPKVLRVTYCWQTVVWNPYQLQHLLHVHTGVAFNLLRSLQEPLMEHPPYMVDFCNALCTTPAPAMRGLVRDVVFGAHVSGRHYVQRCETRETKTSLLDLDAYTTTVMPAVLSDSERGMYDEVARRMRILHDRVGEQGVKDLVPVWAYCRITNRPTIDPVVYSDGILYDRIALCQYIASERQAGRAACSPVTRLPVPAYQLTRAFHVVFMVGEILAVHVPVEQ